MRSEGWSTAAIIPLLFPTEREISQIKKMLLLVDHTFLVINGADSISFISELDDLKCTLLFNYNKGGLSHSLNVGVCESISRGFDWHLILDQDSFLLENPWEKIKRDLPWLRDAKENLGVIALNYSRTHVVTGRTKLNFEVREEYAEITSSVNAGTLIPTATFEMVGMFSEDFYIEGVDTEYYLRMRKFGLRALATKDAVIEHDAGTCMAISLFGKNFTYRFHPPSRHYEQVRNLTYLIRIYFLQEPKWAIKSFLAIFKKFFLAVFLSPDRLSVCLKIIRGFLAGAFGGPLQK